ncbi:MAG TPA: hypothetical protein VFH35_00335 [Ramlibacter sp.]|nr:hypothetical protein [Ramlibacter sp.]
MNKVQITAQKVSEWQEEAEAQIAAGWPLANVRTQLAKNGATPKLIDDIMRKAGRGVRTGNRRAGRGAVLAGLGMMAGAMAIVLLQLLFAGEGAVSVLVPSGLALAGLVTTAGGLLKAVFG